MKEQIPLSLKQLLRYSAENFYLHAGITSLCKAVSAAVRSPGFSLILAVGEPQFGKTHLTVHCAELASTSGRTTKLLEGGEVITWIAEHPQDDAMPRDGALIIDDTQRIFSHLRDRSSSGPFVDLIERCRRRGCMVVLVSSKSPAHFGLDEHVMSRVRAGSIFEIGVPEEQDLDPLLDLIARQRGILLTQFKRAFLLKRVGRGIPAIVECLSRLEEATASQVSAMTSLDNLAEVVSSHGLTPPTDSK